MARPVEISQAPGARHPGPPYRPATTVTMPQEIWDELNIMAQKHGVSRNYLINKAIHDYLVSYKEEP